MPKSVLLLPGLLEDADAFEHQLLALREVATCKVADLTRGETIGELAEQAMREAPAGPLAVIGHSMGGYVALEIARRWPERVERLALLNTHARPDSAESTENRRRLMALAERDFPAVIDTLTPKLLAPAHRQEIGMTGTISEMALATGKEAFARQERAIIGRIDSRPHLAAIRCPTLVVAGPEDAIMPLEWLEELARGIPGARLEVVEGAGHMSSIEKPAEVARLLRHWLET
jgi:pimeloyl-ACP methyl ester carboxylesterase